MRAGKVQKDVLIPEASPGFLCAERGGKIPCDGKLFCKGWAFWENPHAVIDFLQLWEWEKSMRTVRKTAYVFGSKIKEVTPPQPSETVSPYAAASYAQRM